MDSLTMGSNEENVSIWWRHHVFFRYHTVFPACHLYQYVDHWCIYLAGTCRFNFPQIIKANAALCRHGHWLRPLPQPMLSYSDSIQTPSNIFQWNWFDLQNVSGKCFAKMSTFLFRLQYGNTNHMSIGFMNMLSYLASTCHRMNGKNKLSHSR